MTENYHKWDIAEQLDSEEEITAYLAEVFDSGDSAEIRRALGYVARARNMSQLASNTGMSRAGIYKALSAEGNPSFDNIAAIVNSFGFRLTIVPLQSSAPV